MLTTYEPETTFSIDLARMAEAGQAANRIAANYVFSEFQSRKATNTNRRHRQDIAIFAEYLADIGLPNFLSACIYARKDDPEGNKGVYPGDLFSDPEAWRGITWGIVDSFVKWSAGRGYSIGSINVHLSTIRVYSQMAGKALGTDDYRMISTVKGYGVTEGKNLDENRAKKGINTRIGAKKAEAIDITIEQAAQLKNQPDTPQGRRDALLMCLLLEYGLRVGEVAILQVSNFNLSEKMISVYRPKINEWHQYELKGKSLAAARAYLTQDAPALGCIWRSGASKRDGKDLAGSLTDQGASERGMTKRVNTLGKRIGIIGLSAHDCRHYGATNLAKKNTPTNKMMDWGGWHSPAMALRYINKSTVKNKDVEVD